MNLKKIALASVLSLACVPLAASAQAPAKPKIAQGASIYGPQGKLVGTIERVMGENVVVNTGTNSATLPASSFGKSDKGLTITFTQAQLNQAIEAAAQTAQNKLDTALVAGAALRSSDGVPMGVVKTINADGTIVVEREAGSFALKRDQLGTDANGLIVRLTAQQLNDAVGAASDTTAATTDTAAATAPAATAPATATTAPAAEPTAAATTTAEKTTPEKTAPAKAD